MAIGNVNSWDNLNLHHWFDPAGTNNKGGASRIDTLRDIGLYSSDRTHLKELLLTLEVDINNCSDNELQIWLRFLESDEVSALRWQAGQLKLDSRNTWELDRNASPAGREVLESIYDAQKGDKLLVLLEHYDPVKDKLIEPPSSTKSPYGQLPPTRDSSTIYQQISKLGLSGGYKAFTQQSYQVRDDVNANGDLWLTGFHKELAVMSEGGMGVTFSHGIGGTKSSAMGWGGAEIRSNSLLNSRGVLTHTGYLDTSGTKNLGGSFFLYNEGNVRGQRGFEIDLEHNLGGGNKLVFGLWNKHRSLGGYKKEVVITRPTGATSYDAILDMSKDGRVRLHLKWDNQSSWNQYSIYDPSVNYNNLAGLRPMSNIEQFSFDGGRDLLAKRSKSEVDSFTFNNMRFYQK